MGSKTKKNNKGKNNNEKKRHKNTQKSQRFKAANFHVIMLENVRDTK